MSMTHTLRLHRAVKWQIVWPLWQYQQWLCTQTHTLIQSSTGKVERIILRAYVLWQGKFNILRALLEF